MRWQTGNSRSTSIHVHVVAHYTITIASFPGAQQQLYSMTPAVIGGVVLTIERRKHAEAVSWQLNGVQSELKSTVASSTPLEATIHHGSVID